MYYYDINGWLSLEPIEGRSTTVEPMPPDGDMFPNFTGHKWILMRKLPAPESIETPIQDEIMKRIEQLEKETADLKALLVR